MGFDIRSYKEGMKYKIHKPHPCGPLLTRQYRYYHSSKLFYKREVAGVTWGWSRAVKRKVMYNENN